MLFNISNTKLIFFPIKRNNNVSRNFSDENIIKT